MPRRKSRRPTSSFTGAHPDGAAQRQALTTREAEVLCLIAGGRSNQQIAGELGITVNTVERHIANLYRKLQIRSRAQATAYALQHGFIPVLPNQD